jgi:transcription elongation GreA/GreB family factor
MRDSSSPRNGPFTWLVIVQDQRDKNRPGAVRLLTSDRPEGSANRATGELMSRAFVKEADEPIEERPDRPVSPHPSLVTPEGFAAIEANLLRWQQEHAQAPDDRAARAAISRELRYWTSRRASAQVVTAPSETAKVGFGCTVSFVRVDGRRQTYRIVGEDEADPLRGTISYASPLARALMGKEVGDIAELGGSDVEVTSIAWGQKPGNRTDEGGGIPSGVTPSDGGAEREKMGA